MRILIDSIAMKHLEDMWLEKFKDEARILQLSMAMDGVNPYSFPNTNYYVFPILVNNKNMPPQFSVKN